MLPPPVTRHGARRSVAQATAVSLRLPTWAAMVVGLAAAYVAYEAVLFAATWLLASGSGAFTASVIARIFGINVAALALLLGIHHAAGALGWSVGALVPRGSPNAPFSGQPMTAIDRTAFGFWCWTPTRSRPTVPRDN